MRRALSSRKTWTVREGERTLRALLDRSDMGSETVTEGRVFLNSIRVADLDVPVVPGDRVDIYPPAENGKQVRLLGHSEEWIAVEKPAGLVTEPDRFGRPNSVVYQASTLLGTPASSLHAVSRLDRGVSGVVLLRLRRDANTKPRPLPPFHDFSKRYIGIVCGVPAHPAGIWQGSVKGKAGTYQPALTRYRMIGRVNGGGDKTLLELSLMTGRKHQIRQHAAQAHIPLLGDSRYGGKKHVSLASGKVVGVDRIMLHALSVSVGIGPGSFSAACPVPLDMREVWAQLGGNVADLERAGA